MASTYKLLNESNNKGFWINEIQLIDLIKICYRRNNSYFRKLVEIYEHLEGKKFDYSLLKEARG